MSCNHAGVVAGSAAARAWAPAALTVSHQHAAAGTWVHFFFITLSFNVRAFKGFDGRFNFFLRSFSEKLIVRKS